MRHINTSSLYSKEYTWSTPEAGKWKCSILRSDFKAVIGNKCWYSEANLVMSDAHIDHFRPKAMIVPFSLNGKTYNHNVNCSASGYDWLANDYTNYRYSSAYSNRKTGKGGKGNYFPLANNLYGSQQTGVLMEVPLLIDPQVKSDVNLMSVDINGEVICTTSNTTDNERVEISKVVYNLINPDLIEGRKKVWQDISQKIDMSNNASEDMLLYNLQEAIDIRTPYSATAIACIISHSAEIPSGVYSQLNLEL